MILTLSKIIIIFVIIKLTIKIFTMKNLEFTDKHKELARVLNVHVSGDPVKDAGVVNMYKDLDFRMSCLYAYRLMENLPSDYITALEQNVITHKNNKS